ncbi:MAG TPA: hypothetical protein GX497_00695 [Bacillus bacterium]|nr:hypothetical protein [Bacillus sp. (in: firmicutes)]
MKSNTKILLQNIQDIYAENMKMTLYMTDNEGNPITNISGISSFVEFLVYQADLPFLNQLKKIIAKYNSITTCVVINPIECPSHYGVKALLVPIIIDDKIKSYIWCWSYIEEGISDYIKTGMGSAIHNIERNDSIFQLPILSNSQLQQKKEQLYMMATVCIELIKSGYEDEHFLELEQIVKTIKTANIQYYEMLEILKKQHHFDYVGIASLIAGTVEIKSYIGANEESIVGSNFVISGTFFEDIAASRRFEYLGKIGFDPRLSFLMKNGVKTGSFFCYPVIRNEEVIGFIFGGNTTESNKDQSVLKRIQILASIIELGIKKASVESHMDLHLMKLSVLMGTFKSITTIENLQDMLLMIANITNSLIPSHFTTIITRYGDYEYLNITKKVDDKTIYDHANNQRDQYFNIESMGAFHRARVIEKYDTVILECPIYIDEMLFAIIIVSLRYPNDLKEAEVYMKSLAVICGIALKPWHKQLQYKKIITRVPNKEMFHSKSLVDHLTARELDVVKLIVKGMSNKEIGGELYISTHTVKNHISNILNKLGFHDRTQIIVAFYELNNKV